MSMQRAMVGAALVVVATAMTIAAWVTAASAAPGLTGAYYLSCSSSWRSL
jgi:hypothetical protein